MILMMQRSFLIFLFILCSGAIFAEDLANGRELSVQIVPKKDLQLPIRQLPSGPPPAPAFTQSPVGLPAQGPMGVPGQSPMGLPAQGPMDSPAQSPMGVQYGPLQNVAPNSGNQLPQTPLLDSQGNPIDPENTNLIASCPNKQDAYTVNFENIGVIQLIRFISQISDINFIYDEKDLMGITITIVSEEPASVHDLMGTLLQILRMRGLSVVEQGKNILIHTAADNVAKMSTIITDENVQESCNSSVITRVFRVFNVMPDKVAAIIQPLLSKDMATVTWLNETRHLIVTDITANVDKVAELLTALDTPNAALDIGQYTVKTSNPDILVAYAKEILAPLSTETPIQIIPQPGSGKIFIVSTPYLIQRTVQVLGSLDESEITEAIELPPQAMANNLFRVYKLQFRNGQDIADAIHDIGVNLQYNGVGNQELISAIYSIQWIDVNNSIVITGTQEAVNKVVELIQDLDSAPDQVYIEVLIIDTTIANSLNFGVEWISLANEQNKLAFASGLLDSTGAGSLLGGARAALNSPPPNAARGGAAGTGDVPLSTGFGLGIVGNIIRHNGQSILTLGALINALESDSDTSIVLNPRIMTEDTREANFFVGENIPYQTTSTIVRDTGSVTQNIQYEDIGIQLRVRPQVGPNRIVTMDIDQSISDVKEPDATIITGPGTTQVLLAPTTTKTLATTRVHVPDGCFLVMSGHIRDESTYTRSGIPCLGSLPLVGTAFSSTLEQRSKRNLMMFIQPHVIHNIREGIKLTNQEGYNFNWDSHPSSIIDCEPRRAPECETYPPVPCPCR